MEMTRCSTRSKQPWQSLLGNSRTPHRRCTASMRKLYERLGFLIGPFLTCAFLTCYVTLARVVASTPDTALIEGTR
eukprot:COSAG01_NODE_707_length_14133_cov_34.324093_11_plen_76_part_00